MSVRLFVFFRHLQRAMDGIERNVNKKWLALLVFSNEPHCFAREQCRAVSFIARNFVVAMPVKTAIARVFEIIYGPVVMPILPLEPTPRRKVFRGGMSQVPLPENGRRISRFPQSLGQR